MSLAGKTIGRYRILDQLGQGGMAVVYKAFDTRLQRDVAIKVIRIDTIPPVQLEELLKRFEREALAQAQFEHPNIISVYDYGDHENAPYLVMAYRPGGTLQKVTGKPMPYYKAAALLAPIADALAYAHEMDVLHRDIKPSNILLDSRGIPALTDFGIAKLLGEVDGPTLTGTGMGIGTPQYMAPEQWRGNPVKATDIYALGVVFYELITGRKPYDADTPAALIVIQVTEPLPRPTSFVVDLPDHVEKVLFKALAPNPEDRYESMEEFAKVLAKLSLEGKAVEETPAESPMDSTQVEVPIEEPPKEPSPPIPEPSPVEEYEIIDTLVPADFPTETTPPAPFAPPDADDEPPAEPTKDGMEDIVPPPISPPAQPVPMAPRPTPKPKPKPKFPFWGFALIGLAGLVFAGFVINAVIQNLRSTPTPIVEAPAEPSNNDTDGANTTDNGQDESPAEVIDLPEFKNTDTYVYVTYVEPESLDPSWTYETAGWSIQTNIYEGLVWFDKDKTDSFVGLLATDWSSSNNSTRWTFNIREGVTFHEGGTLEPHDIAYSMQRALLQDRSGGPHWMTHEVFFGTYTVDGTMNIATGNSDLTVANASSSQLRRTCEYIKSAIVADDSAGTVTFYLDTPAPWFLAILANPSVGATYDQEWMAENGDWDGDCSTWQNFYDPDADESILFNYANGTGPYKLDHWTIGEEIVLVANQNYWRADNDPIWLGGPAGVPQIKRVVQLIVSEFDTRLAMFEAGDADFITVDYQDYYQLEPSYGTVYCYEPDNPVTCPPEEGGWIQVYSGYQNPVMTPAQFNQNIVEDDNAYIGSGELDGNGIPSDFFTDVHIRRAFSYCMDYDTMIAEALDGQGAQAQGPIIEGMLGYRNDGYVYSYDLDKCAEEFQASETGVWDIGFYMQLAYNTGNETRRLAAEILKEGIEAVNPNFQITIVDMPWPVLLNTRRESKLPIYVGGWIEDYHDPHNWVHPFLHSDGAYAAVNNIQEPLRSTFDNLINEGVNTSDTDTRREIYEEIQLIAQEEAPMIWLYQPVGRTHLSPYIHGWYYNAAYYAPSFSYIYALEKSN